MRSRRTVRLWLFALTALGALIVPGGLCRARAPSLGAEEPPRQRVTQEVTVLLNGDIQLVHTVRLPLRAYTALKDEVRNTALLLRRLGVEGQATVFRDSKAEYDDAQSAVRVQARMVGGAKNHGAVWHVPIVNAREQEVLEVGPDRLRLLTIATLKDGTDQVITTNIVFPAGTRGVHLDAAAGRVEAQMPPPPSAPQGKADLHLDLESRPELMSCFYKLYGLPDLTTLWVARAVFENRGAGAAREFGVRFRIPGFAEWSPWQRSGWVYPGQSVVEAYYPILGRAVLELTGETPAQLELEWTAEGADGAALRGQETRPLKLLGMNEVIWSSLPAEEATSWAELFDHTPLVAATFVSHTDPVVQRFAGMAAALSGGTAATKDDASALRFMRAVYELMAANHLAYHSPPGILKENPRQHVKFARDVLRNRAGTCIDLAILFASTCQAGGLTPLLVFVPGHAFPAVRLPSGELQPLEATAISVAPTGKAMPFEEAIKAGEHNMDRALERGLYMLVDIQAMRVRGVPPPELPTLAGDPLADWGIEQKGLGTGPERPAPTPAGAATWKHPNGLFSVAPPQGWQIKVDGEGVDLAPAEPQVQASVVVEPRGASVTSRDFAEEVLLALLPSGSAPPYERTVLSHVEGTTTDKRHARSSIQCSVEAKGKSFYEDLHFVLGRTRRFTLMLHAPKEAWERIMPALRALVASFVVHDEPAEARAPTVHRDVNGAFLLQVPAGWTATRDAEGDLVVKRGGEVGAVFLRCLERSPDVRTADALASDLSTLFTQGEAAKGAKVEVVARNRSLAGGTKIAVTSILLRSTRSDGAVQQREVHAFVGKRTMTLLAMDAPLRVWPLWLPSFRHVFGSFTLDDQPLPGADAALPGTAQADVKPPATPPQPPTPREPPTVPVPPLEVYEDPAGLFRLHVPKGWKIEGQPLGVSASTLRGDAIVTFTLGQRGADSHDVFSTAIAQHLATSFAGWKELGRALGGGGEERTLRLEASAVVDGTPVHMLVDISTSPRFQQFLLLVCPLSQRAAYAPLWDAVLEHYVEVTGGWPDERPLVRLRSVTPDRLPYLLEVPSTWRVEPQGADIVARSLHGDALLVARASPKAHESIDALGTAILASMQSRGHSAQILSQEVREEQGRQVLVARLRDEVGGVTWEREVRALQTPTHDLQLILSTRADVRFKWEALLGRIVTSWKPR